VVSAVSASPTLGFGTSSTAADRGKPQSYQKQHGIFDVADVDATKSAASYSSRTTTSLPVQAQPAVGAEEREAGFAEGQHSSSPDTYPQDPLGFLNGLVEGLTHVSGTRCGCCGCVVSAVAGCWVPHGFPRGSLFACFVSDVARPQDKSLCHWRAGQCCPKVYDAVFWV
jgi:hypothetical protein